MLTERGDKQVLILVGPAGSGKGTAASFLKDTYQLPVIRYSTFLREILERLDIDRTRPEISKLSLGLRELYGQDIFAQTISKELDTYQDTLVILDGARRAEDITKLTTKRRIHTLYIEAASSDRFDRITERNENADDTTKTLASFQTDEAHDTEVTIPPLKDMADSTIVNDGSLKDFYIKLRSLIETIV